MKFRFKVLFLNLLLLTLALSAIVFFVMQRSTHRTEKNLLLGAVQENSFLENSIQYELLSYLDLSEGERDAKESISHYFETTDTVNSYLTPDTALFCIYDTSLAYATDPDDQPPASLWSSLENGYKSEMQTRRKGRVYLYTASASRLYNRPFYVITRRDVTSAYQELSREAVTFSLLTCIILLASAVFLYIISRLVTRPMEELTRVTDKFAAGDYAKRSQISSGDEIGVLSQHFNHLADSVEAHVAELGDMIHRRDQFVADFTHEIKTPMTSIIGYADTMRRMDLSDEDRTMSLNYIYSEGKRLESMSLKLFDLIYLNDHPLQLSPLSGADLMKKGAASASPMLEKKHQTLETHCVDGQLLGDAELLQTVLVNLLDNARKASAEGAVICLSGKPAAEKNAESDPADESPDAWGYEISVRDTGIGMTEDVVKHITDEFFMADKSRSRNEGGAGLGMSLVAAILKQHGAKLSIDSAPGEGTTVTILFPAAGTVPGPEDEGNDLDDRSDRMKMRREKK